VLVLVLASVDCSSRVLYLPFMGSFKPEYLTSYFIGEGLSGFIPSVVALVQGSGGTPECVNITIPPENNTISVLSTPEPLFSVAVFFYFMAVMSIVSAIAFHLLNVNSVVRNCTVDLHSVTEERDFNLQSSPVKFYNSTPIVKPKDVALCDKVDDMELEQVESSNICQSEAVYQTTDTSALSSAEFAYLMVLLTIICGLSNGIFPAIQSYSALPYGHAAYHWTVALSNMANPGVCFLMLLGKTPDKSIASVIAVPAFIVSTYVLYSALRSPYPPLVGSSLGIILLVNQFFFESKIKHPWNPLNEAKMIYLSLQVLSWVLLVGLFTYVKVLIATVMRGSGGKKGLFWTGAYTQLGSTFGAIIAFLLINVGNVFQSFNPCA